MPRIGMSARESIRSMGITILLPSPPLLSHSHSHSLTHLESNDSILAIDVLDGAAKLELDTDLLCLFEECELHVGTVEVPDTIAETLLLPAFPVGLFCEDGAVRVTVHHKLLWERC